MDTVQLASFGWLMLACSGIFSAILATSSTQLPMKRYVRCGASCEVHTRPWLDILFRQATREDDDTGML